MRPWSATEAISAFSSTTRKRRRWKAVHEAETSFHARELERHKCWEAPVSQTRFWQAPCSDGLPPPASVIPLLTHHVLPPQSDPCSVWPGQSPHLPQWRLGLAGFCEVQPASFLPPSYSSSLNKWITILINLSNRIYVTTPSRMSALSR